MAERSKAEFRSALAGAAQHSSIALSSLGGAVFATSATLMALGGPLDNATDTRQIVFGAVAFVVAAALGVLREWAQGWVDNGQRTSAAKYHTAVKDALKPVAELIAEMPSRTPGQRRGRLNQVAHQVAGSMQLLLSEVEGLRTVVYEVRDDAQRLTQIAYSGRGDKPGDFERHPQGEADEAFDALEQNRSRMVPDVRVEKAAAQHRHGIDHGYLAYIAVPIVVSTKGYGMLTLDAPQPDSFTKTDLYLCEFVAELLSVAFASALDSRP